MFLIFPMLLTPQKDMFIPFSRSIIRYLQKKYVTELKLHHICHLLEYSSKSIKELSDLAGFHCYEHFLRTFKKNMGCTPTEYRKNWEQTASRG